ncbi:MAG: PEP-CTERM sorting domain-containing protein [Planctomycetota bacterium]
MLTRTLTAAAAVAALGISSAASAQLLASDSYVIGSDPAAGEYQVLPLVSQPGTLESLGFADGNYGGGTGTVQFAASDNGLSYAPLGIDGSLSGKVTYSAAPVDPFRRANARNLVSGTPGTSPFYVSHLVNRGGIAPTGDADSYALTGFGNFVQPTIGANSGFLDGVFVGFAQKSSTDSGSLVIRSRTTTGQTAEDTILIDGDLVDTANLTYNIVYKATVNADSVTYWVNATDFTDDASLTATALVTGTINGFQFGDANLDRLNYDARAWNGNVFFDEPMIALAPSDLIVPEPTTAAVLALGGIGAMLRRRRA